MSHPLQDFQRTVGTTAAVLEFTRLHAPGARLVLASSGAVYGAVERTPIEEGDPLRPVSPYGTHKVMAEQLCRSYCEHHEVRAGIVRFFSLFGPELRKQLLWDASQIILRGGNGFFGTGEERRDLLHVSDAVGLLLAAAGRASAECPVVNGGNGEGVAVREILEELFAAHGRTDAPAFSQQARGGDPAVYIASTARAKTWGWAPAVAWRQGVKEYADWFRANVS
jgi:UDP-glucose 4-epimerase